MAKPPARIDPPHVPHVPAQLGHGIPGRSDLIGMWLSGRSPRTLETYARSLDDFARHVGIDSAARAVEWFLSLDAGQANATAIGWRNAMVDAGKAPATVALRLAALRSIIKLARTIGMVAWTLTVDAPRARTLKDTAGPGTEGWRSMLATAKGEADDMAGKRNLALIRLLHDTALRVSEAIGLDMPDLELDRPAILVTAKGYTEPIRLTIPPQVKEAIAAWLTIRGGRPGPVFHRLDRAADVDNPGRLTTRAVRMIVGDLADRAQVGRRVWPHALRHAGITEALDKTGGDVRAVMKFSRHQDVRTLFTYDDNRRDEFGRIAGIVSED